MLFLNSELETLPREKLAALQLQKLRKLLEELWGKNAFYTNKLSSAGVAPGDIRTLADLSRLPLTSKKELVTDQAGHPPFGTNLTYALERYIRFHQTSGTTGAPLIVLDTNSSWDWWGLLWSYVLCGAGLGPGDRLFTAFSFGLFIGFWAAVEGARKLGVMMVPGGGRDSLQRLQLMRDSGATALCCTPTYALRLAEVARENDFDLDKLSVRVLVNAGEPGANVPETKRRIEASWNAKCYDHAGASEVGGHSFECQAQSRGIHLIESEFIAEVLDTTTGSPVEPGEVGELVLTNLGRAGFPVIRYRTGDVVRPTFEPCECGRTWMRFQGGIIGRSDDMITVRGVNVFPSAVENIIRRFQEVDEFQVNVYKVREMEEMDVDLELVEGADPAVGVGVARALNLLLSFRPNVQVVPRGQLPRYELKAKRFRVRG